MKITRIEKIMLLFIVFFMSSLILLALMFTPVCKKAAEKIGNKGLKSIVNQVWEGKGERVD